MDAALHQHARAAHLESLGDFLVDLLEVENVAVVGVRVGLAVDGQRTVEGAEGAVLGAVVGVVDIAIDDVGDHALGMQSAAHSVGLESQSDQVRGLKVIECLLARDRHGFNSTEIREQRPEHRGPGAGEELHLPLNRKIPRVSNARPCVRARLEAVEMPLNRMKKSRNALTKPFLFSAAIAEEPFCSTIHL